MPNVQYLAATQCINFERSPFAVQFYPENLIATAEGLIQTVQANLPCMPGTCTRVYTDCVAALARHSELGSFDECTVIITGAHPATFTYSNGQLLSFNQRLA